MDGDTAIDVLRTTGRDVAPEVRGAILAAGERAVAPLVAIMNDDELGDERAIHGGWPPIHAVELLADLGPVAAAAVEPMLDVLEATEFDHVIHDRIIVRLPRIGAPALEPVLARLERAVDEHHFSELCSVLCDLGVRDERIFEALCANFEEDVVLGAGQFADYGDPRALPLIAEALAEFEIDWSTPAPLFGLADLVDSYRDLAGAELPSVLQEHVDGLRARYEASRRPARAAKVGRNDACPCGSGKKFKKCCIGKSVGPA